MVQVPWASCIEAPRCSACGKRWKRETWDSPLDVGFMYCSLKQKISGNESCWLLMVSANYSVLKV